MEQEPKHYYAFISYKHEDAREAKRLQRTLEYYRLPNNLRQENPDLPEYVRPVFRDITDLEVGELSTQLHEALDQSHFLIVVCSPRAAKSKWVNDEIAYFISIGKQDKIIPYIIDGIPHASNPDEECYPPALLALSKEKELLGANVNEVGKDSAAIRVVSRMFDIRFDTLYQRYRRAKRRNDIIRYSTIAIFILFLVSFLLFVIHSNSLLKEQNWSIMRNQARMVSEKAMELVAEGDVIRGIALVVNMLPTDLKNPSRPFLYELERALRAADDSLVYGEGPKCAMKRHYGCVYDASCSENNIVVTTSNDNTIRLWNLNTGEEYRVWRTDEVKYYNVGNITISPNGKYLIKPFSNEDHSLSVWELKEKGLVFTKRLSEGQHPSFSVDGKYLYIEKYDFETGFSEITYNTRGWDSITSVLKNGYYSADRSLQLVTSEGNGFDLIDNISKRKIMHYRVSEWDASDTQNSNIHVLISPNNKFALYYNDIVNLESRSFFSFNGEFLSFCNNGEAIIITNTIYDENNKTTTSWLSLINANNGIEMCRIPVPGVARVALESPNGDIFVGLESGVSYVYANPFVEKKKKWTYLVSMPKHSKPSVSKYFKYVMTEQNDSLFIYEKINHKISLINKYEFPYKILAVSLNPSVIVAQREQVIIDTIFNERFPRYESILRMEVWNMEKNSCKTILEERCHTPYESLDALRSIAISDDGKSVAYSDNSVIYIWNVMGDSIVQKMIGHRNNISHLVFSADGKYLISTCYDYTLRVWDTNNGEEIQEKRLFFPSIDYYGTANLRDAKLSADNKYLAVFVGKSINLYDFASMSLLETIAIPEDTYSIDFSDNSNELLVYGKSGLFKHDIIPFLQLYNKYKSLRTFPFSKEEKRSYFIE